jgi:hypothetical protein
MNVGNITITLRNTWVGESKHNMTYISSFNCEVRHRSWCFEFRLVIYFL